MEKLSEKLHRLKIVPVVKINAAKDAAPLADALVRGGLPCAEVTFRTDAAAEAIRQMKRLYPDMLIGAGTVLDETQVDAAIAAGAKFIVSPGLNPVTVKYCQEKKIPVLPGVATATEIEQALSLGLKTVKFFPAEVNGGLNAIKALAAPYTMMRFMPTGGVNLQNVRDYLGFEKVIACGGTWMVKDELIQNGQFGEIEKLTREAVEAINK